MAQPTLLGAVTRMMEKRPQDSAKPWMQGSRCSSARSGRRDRGRNYSRSRVHMRDARC